MNWMVWAFAVIVSSVTYQTSAKIFSGKLPIFVYTTIVSLTMLAISLIALGVTYKSTDFAVLDHKKVLLACWLGFASFMIEFTFYFLYKNNAPISVARMLILAGSAIILLFVGVVFFKERFNSYQVFGSVLCLLGLYFIIMWKPKV
ncbi:MAG: EamA-like transporter family [Alphaproteobacteria bacterium]|nr:EamA-like transporter family [Alphaproteobacteria bacterium]